MNVGAKYIKKFESPYDNFLKARQKEAKGI